MATDERAAWLAGLKVGDEVALISDQRWYGRKIAADNCKFSRSDKISKLTSTNFYVGDHRFPTKFNRLTGNSLTSAGSIYSCHLMPLTEEDRQSERCGRLLHKVKGVNWDALATASLEAIAAVLDEPVDAGVEGERDGE